MPACARCTTTATPGAGSDARLRAGAGGRGGQAPLLTIFGGKITTFRRLAEEALGGSAPLCRRPPRAVDRAAPLPGGDFPQDGFDALPPNSAPRYPFLAEPALARLCRAYGTLRAALSAGAAAGRSRARISARDLTERGGRAPRRARVGGDPDDILWRRTKLGLRLSAAQAAEVEHAMGALTAAEPVDSASPHG